MQFLYVLTQFIMKKFGKLVVMLLPVLFMALMAFSVFADNQVTVPGGITYPNQQVTGVTLSGILTLIKAIMNFLVTGGVLIGIAFVVYGGIKYILSSGEAEAATAARKIILNGLIGIGVILGVGLLVNTVAGLVSGSFFGSSGYNQ